MIRSTRRALRGAQLCRLRFAGERVPLGRLRPLAAGLPLHRRDECQRAAGSRAVVVGHPERQLEQGLGEHLDDALDR